jgi:hypothetical protein
MIQLKRRRNTLSELRKGQKYLEYEGDRERVPRNLGVLKKLGLGAAGALGLGVAKEVWDLIP